MNQDDIEKGIARTLRRDADVMRATEGRVFINGEASDRCPKPHEVSEGSADITAVGDKRRQYLCLDCGQKWEGGEIQLAMPNPKQ